MTNYKSYDAITGAKEDFVRKIGGREVRVAKTLPAIVSINYQRKARSIKSENEALDTLFELGEKMLRDEWEYCAENLELPQLLELVQDLMIYYGLRDEEDQVDVEGKAEAPAAKPEAKPVSPLPTTTSSENGDTSMLISNSFGLVPASGSIAEN